MLAAGHVGVAAVTRRVRHSDGELGTRLNAVRERPPR